MCSAVSHTHASMNALAATRARMQNTYMYKHMLNWQPAKLSNKNVCYVVYVCLCVCVCVKDRKWERKREADKERAAWPPISRRESDTTEKARGRGRRAGGWGVKGSPSKLILKIRTSFLKSAFQIRACPLSFNASFCEVINLWIRHTSFLLLRYWAS